MRQRRTAALSVLALTVASVAATFGRPAAATSPAGGTAVAGPWGTVQLPPGGGYHGAPPQQVSSVQASATGEPVMSSNWSGYVESGAQFTGVAGSWTVPSVAPSQAFADVAPWVGIDGVSDGTLIQTGTDTETQNGQTTSFAWVETLPQAAQVIGPVTPGDQMHASVTETTPGTWTLSIADLTSGQSFTNPVSYSTPGHNAEWITEAVFHDGQPPSLANYGSVPYSGVTFQPTSGGTTATPFIMKAGGQTVSYPTAQSSSGSFSTIYGSPSSPTSSTTSTSVVSQKPVIRLFGPDRIATAIAVSKDAFPSDHSAPAAVLATASAFADALSGAPLAAAKNGPLLLSATDSLSPPTSAELQRALAPGATVYLLGGPKALSDAVASAIQAQGFTVVRYAGPDRFGTAATIAEQGLGTPTTVLEADGLNFPDAIAAGAAAAKIHGAVLLTMGTSAADETNAYLSAHPPIHRYAVGGAAATADPAATPLVGADRYETATILARTFFSSPATVGIASGTAFPDALAGGPNIATKGGPLILAPPSGPLPAPVISYLQANANTIDAGFAYGGSLAVGDDVVTEVQQTIG